MFEEASCGFKGRERYNNVEKKEGREEKTVIDMPSVALLAIRNQLPSPSREHGHQPRLHQLRRMTAAVMETPPQWFVIA